MNGPHVYRDDDPEVEMGVAWSDAVAALPFGWWIQLDAAYGGPYRAMAGEPTWSPEYCRVESVAPDAAAALRGLTTRLRALPMTDTGRDGDAVQVG